MHTNIITYDQWIPAFIMCQYVYLSQTFKPKHFVIESWSISSSIIIWLYYTAVVIYVSLTRCLVLSGYWNNVQY